MGRYISERLGDVLLAGPYQNGGCLDAITLMSDSCDNPQFSRFTLSLLLFKEEFLPASHDPPCRFKNSEFLICSCWLRKSPLPPSQSLPPLALPPSPDARHVCMRARGRASMPLSKVCLFADRGRVNLATLHVLKRERPDTSRCCALLDFLRRLSSPQNASGGDAAVSMEMTS